MMGFVFTVKICLIRDLLAFGELYRVVENVLIVFLAI